MILLIFITNVTADQPGSSLGVPGGPQLMQRDIQKRRDDALSGRGGTDQRRAADALSAAVLNGKLAKGFAAHAHCRFDLFWMPDFRLTSLPAHSKTR
jgi:hypothetical protein